MMTQQFADLAGRLADRQKSGEVLAFSPALPPPASFMHPQEIPQIIKYPLSNSKITATIARAGLALACRVRLGCPHLPG